MKGAEAQRRLERIGWLKIRGTASGHEIWRSPNGKLKTLSLGHQYVERNQVALVRQAERAAANQEGTKPMEVQMPETMTSAAALASAPKAGADKPKQWDFKVYRTPDTVKSSFVELAFGEAALKHLGGPGVRVSVELDADGFWMLRSGGPLLVKAEGVSRYKVKTTAMTDALPHTGRTPIPVERCANGFRLFPHAVTPSATRRKARGVSDADSDANFPQVLKRLHQELSQPAEPEAHQASMEAEQPPTTPEPTSSPGGALEAEQSASLAKFGTSFAARPVAPKKAASLDDLRAAMRLLREVVDELGVTLYTTKGLMIQLDDIEFGGKL